MTNQAAARAIAGGRVSVNDEVIQSNTVLPANACVTVDGVLIKAPRILNYFAFHKPRGFISSMNRDVAGNLAHFFPASAKLSIAGRLDKESEGLLLLSNDGKWIEKICHPSAKKQKEYEVTLSNDVDENMLARFREGIGLRDGTQTLPAACEKIENTIFRIILEEGKYRQIRRMCHVCGAAILSLKRTKIAGIELGGLSPGEFRSLTNKEIDQVNGF